MGFFSDITSSIVKISLTPLAIVCDGVKVVIGEEPNTTKDLLNSAGDDLIK